MKNLSYRTYIYYSGDIYYIMITLHFRNESTDEVDARVDISKEDNFIYIHKHDLVGKYEITTTDKITIKNKENFNKTFGNSYTTQIDSEPILISYLDTNIPSWSNLDEKYQEEN